MKKTKKAQIWIETVIYTLIGLVLIGMVLAIAVPFINEQKDKRIVEDTLSSLNLLDNKIDEVKKLGPGNQRQVDMIISNGRLVIDGSQYNSVEKTGNQIIFEIDESVYAASETGRGRDQNIGALIEVPGTNLKMKTDSIGKKKYSIIITREFKESLDLQFNGEDENGELGKAAAPYRLIVENIGRENPDGSVRINIYEAS